MAKTSKKSRKKTEGPSTLEIMLKEKFGDKAIKVYNLINGTKEALDIMKEAEVTKEELLEIFRFLEESGFIKLEPNRKADRER